MARLGCKCGAEMANTISPSKNRLSIYYIQEVKDAINSNPQIRLWDFYTGWDEKNNCNNSFQDRNEPVEYWYCTSCKRVYEVQAESCGKIMRTYALEKEKKSEKIDISSLTELLVLTDEEMDKLLAQNEKLTLQDYLAQRSTPRVYITADEKTVYITDIETRTTHIYLCEDTK